VTSTNVEVVRKLYAAYANRELDTILSVTTDETVVEQDAGLPWGGRHTGPDGFLAFLGTLASHVDAHLEIGDIYDAGADTVIEVGYTKGHVLANGTEFRAREIHKWQFREDGKLASFTVWVDVPAMQAALDGEPVKS